MAHSGESHRGFEFRRLLRARVCANERPDDFAAPGRRIVYGLAAACGFDDHCKSHFCVGCRASPLSRRAVERARFCATRAPTIAPQNPATWEATGPTLARSIPKETAQNPIRLRPATL